MPINLAPLPQFPSRNLGQWAECALPVQGRDSFSDIFLRVAGQGYGVAGMPLDIVLVVDTIELQQDGETVLSVSPRALRLLESARNATADAPDVSVLHIPLARLGLSSVSDWPTGKMGKFLLRVLLKPVLPINITANFLPLLSMTDLTAHARSEQLPELMGRGAVFTFHMASHMPVAGVNIIENISLRNLRKLTKLVLFCPVPPGSTSDLASNSIVSVRVTLGREVVFDATKQVAVAELIASGLYRGRHLDASHGAAMALLRAQLSFLQATSGRAGFF